jgi:DNA-directed RNA polymerase specialized sigma24 family protein
MPLMTKEEKLNIEALYQQHQNELIYHVFGILHCRDIATNIVQESYIKLLREAERQKIERPRSLLFHIAHNLALDYLKHRKVTESYARSEDPTLVPTTESPSRAIGIGRPEAAYFKAGHRRIAAPLPPGFHSA